MFPPPKPPETPPPPVNKQLSAWWVVGIVFALLAVFVWARTQREDGESSSTPSRPKFTWTDELCTPDDYSGTFTNTGSTTLTVKLWAKASRGGKVVARDEEYVQKLGPGESTTVEFVWVADGSIVCTLDRVERP